MNTKLHSYLRFHLNEGQRSDFKGAEVLLKNPVKGGNAIWRKGYDCGKIRNTLSDQGITPCIPSKRNRKKPAEYCRTLYKTRHRNENLFAKLRDWHRIANR